MHDLDEGGVDVLLQPVRHRRRILVRILDEVDANVGGETANAVGEKMRQIADKRQVLCITHLPQVAAAGTAHYVVSKQVKEGRTISEISLLNKKERVVELTRMLGGQTDAARKHAEALLESKQFNEAAQAYTSLIARFPEAANNDAIQLHLGKALLGARQAAQAAIISGWSPSAGAESK